MKTKILILVLMIFAGMTSVEAQKLAFGIKGGVNLGKIDGNSFKDEFKTGYQVGGFATIPFGSVIAIQPEVLFNQTNTRVVRSTSGIISTNDLKDVELKELLIPVLLNVNLNKVFTLQVGPQFGIVTDQGKSFIQNGEDAFKSGNFAVAAGLQLNLSKFRIYGRFTTGVNNLNDVSMNNFRNDESWKVQNIQLGVGLSLF